MMKNFKQSIKFIFLTVLVLTGSSLVQAQTVYEQLINRRLVSPINPEVPRSGLNQGASDSVARYYNSIPERLARLESVRNSAAEPLRSEGAHDGWAEHNFLEAQAEVDRFRILNNLPMDPESPIEKTFIGSVFGQLWAAARTILSIQFKITNSDFLQAKAELTQAINNDLAFDSRATQEQLRISLINYKAALHAAIFNHVNTTETNIGAKLAALDNHMQVLKQSLQVFKTQKNNSAYLLVSAIIAADELLFPEVRTLLEERTRKRLQIFNDWLTEIRRRVAEKRGGNSCIKLFN